MVAGVDADPLLLPSVTCTPPAPAGAANVTVPVAEFPPVTGFGTTLTPVTVPRPGPPPPAGLITSGVVAVLLDVALIMAVVWLFTGVVVTGKVPLLCPAGIVIVAGVEAEPLLLPSVTC